MEVCFSNSEIRMTDRFSVAYAQNWRYPRKSMFIATERLTGVPVVVLGHSVGTVGS